MIFMRLMIAAAPAAPCRCPAQPRMAVSDTACRTALRLRQAAAPRKPAGSRRAA